MLLCYIMHYEVRIFLSEKMVDKMAQCSTAEKGQYRLVYHYHSMLCHI